MMMTILEDNHDDIGQVHWLYLVTMMMMILARSANLDLVMIMMMILADNDDDIGQCGVR